MKKNLSAYIEAVILLAVLTIPVGLIARNDQHLRHQPHHYQIVDLASTFGGPQSYFVPGSGDDFAGSSVLNRGGTVAGFADTSMPDPFPNFCFSDCFVSQAFQAGSGGVLTDLGALPGGGSSAPIWITANGLIAGVSENGQTDPLYPGGFPEMHAVLWQQGMITDLGTLPEGGYQSEANSVNSAGQVVGSALNTIPDANSMAAGNFWFFDVPYGYQQRAFLWDRQKGMQDLGTLPGGTDALALLINDRGQVVGESYTASTQSGACFPLASRAFLWEKEKGMTDLGGFGGTCTTAGALNNKGQVVGESFRKGDKAGPAFLWENGTLHELGGSLGGDFTGAFAINEKGEAAGFGYLRGNSTFHATLWKNLNEITDLGVVGGDPCSYAAAVNAKMQVVGASIADCDDEFRAFLWEDGSIFDLNSLIPPASALYLQLTFAINDRGEIAGQGIDSSGNEHAFLLIPCDDNHPGVEGCNYSLVDASEAVRQIPASAMHKPTLFPARVPARSLTGSMRIKTGTTTLTSANTVEVLPTITSFTPVSGPVGISTSITGTGLKQTTKVTFGGVVAIFVVNSNTQVTATVPSDAVTGKIAVTTPGGYAVSSGTFTVSTASVLTGYCLHPGLSCSETYDPAECPPRATPKDPGTAQCGFPIDRAYVDIARTCKSGGVFGFCSRTASGRPKPSAKKSTKPLLSDTLD